MLEYEFEKVPCGRGVFVGKIPGEKHREIILRRGKEGWRFAGWIPTLQQGHGYIGEIDLVFEREGQA